MMTEIILLRHISKIFLYLKNKLPRLQKLFSEYFSEAWEKLDKKSTNWFRRIFKKKTELHGTFPNTQERYHRQTDNLLLFDERFRFSFPAIMEPHEISDLQRAIEKLELLVSPPAIRDGKEIALPIYWQRGIKSDHVRYFKKVRRFGRLNGEFILNDQHHKIKRIIACPMSDFYWLKFVYVECEGLEPTGFEESHSKYDDFFYKEVFANYGTFFKRKLSYSEVYDGAHEVKGKSKRIKGSPKLLTRYIGRYNFILHSIHHPANSVKCHQPIETICNNILKGVSTVDDLVSYIKKLHKPQEF
jgi:hypothetical protein